MGSSQEGLPRRSASSDFSFQKASGLNAVFSHFKEPIYFLEITVDCRGLVSFWFFASDINTSFEVICMRCVGAKHLRDDASSSTLTQL